VLADSMLTVCPNCATSYGVEMASVRLPKGWACEVRCHRCHCVWKAELSVADKLIVAADAVAPVQRAMAAAQALVGDVTWSPPLQGSPRLALDKIVAGLAGVRTVQIGPPDASGYAAARVDWRSAMLSLFARYEAGRPRHGWRLSLSRAHLLIVALLVADATIIGLRGQVTWLMPQTASFYSAFGLPVDLYALRFDNVAAVAERRDAKPVLVVNGKISNSRTRTETVPRLRFAVRDADHQEIFSWSAAPVRDNLGARESIQFRSELALPPPDTRDVVVRFDHDDGL
jgi:predicted Zn finger-like uncharacterized protein